MTGFVAGLLVGLLIAVAVFSVNSGIEKGTHIDSGSKQSAHFVRWQENEPGYWLAKDVNGRVYKCWEQGNNSDDARLAWGKCRDVTILARTSEGDEVRCIPKDAFFSIPSDGVGFCEVRTMAINIIPQ
jgi:hypothetical protein